MKTCTPYEENVPTSRRRPRAYWRLRLAALCFAVSLLGLAPRGAYAQDYIFNHIYLYTSGDAYDCTSSLNGSYVTGPSGTTIYVTLDYARGTVYDINNNLIGFIYQP
jgi:hypothetical protein